MKKSKSGRIEYNLNQGIKKLNQDLDITKMIEVLQSAEIMRYLVLTKEDQFLLKNQRSKVIDSSDDNNNDLLSDQKIVDKADSELFDLEAQYQNINKIFTQGDRRMNES